MSIYLPEFWTFIYSCFIYFFKYALYHFSTETLLSKRRFCQYVYSQNFLTYYPFRNTALPSSLSNLLHPFHDCRSSLHLRFFQNSPLTCLFLITSSFWEDVIFILVTQCNYILYQIVPCVVLLFPTLNCELFDGRYVVLYFFYSYSAQNRNGLKLGYL